MLLLLLFLYFLMIHGWEWRTNVHKFNKNSYGKWANHQHTHCIGYGDRSPTDFTIYIYTIWLNIFSYIKHHCVHNISIALHPFSERQQFWQPISVELLIRTWKEIVGGLKCDFLLVCDSIYAAHLILNIIIKGVVVLEFSILSRSHAICVSLSVCVCVNRKVLVIASHHIIASDIFASLNAA